MVKLDNRSPTASSDKPKPGGSPKPGGDAKAADDPKALDDASRELLIDVPADGVLMLTLNRPAARNALNLSLLQSLAGAIAEAGQAKRIRAIVLRGSGPAFCAGHDLNELRGARRQGTGGLNVLRETFERCSALMLAIRRCPKPVIAQVHGMATAAGCQLVASADLAIAADTARFATPGVNIGLFCSTPQVALSRAVGRKQAVEMLLTGDAVSAAHAAQIGLINRCVEADRLEADTLALARKIAEKPAAVVALGKRGFQDQLELDPEQAYALTTSLMIQNMMMPEADEGIAAFLEKRPPHWP